MRKVLLASVVVLLFVLTMLPTTAVADPLSKDGTIYYNSHENIYLGSWSDSGDRKVTVTTNASVDVYILTSDDQFSYPETFTPVKAIEKTTNAEFKFTARSGTSYYLVIDNLDNSRSGDAIPKGDVTYVATYPNILDNIGDDIETFAWTCIGIVVLVVVLIIVVIVVVIYLVTRKKKPAAQPPMTHQQQQYQQPGYQQQQQPGYTQQSPPPSQYEPPPPSPYEPPPPPPY